MIALVAVIIAVDCARVHSVPSLMVYRYKKDTICFKMVSFFDLLPLASVNKVSVFNDFEYFFINTHLKFERAIPASNR